MARGRSLENSPRVFSRSSSRESVCSLLSSSSSFSDSPERSIPMDIIIKGLSRNVNAEHLREIFSTFGPINHIKLDDDKEWKHKRCGIINFSGENAAALSIECMDGGQIDGMVVEVEYFSQEPGPAEFVSSRRQQPSSRGTSSTQKRRPSPEPRNSRNNTHRSSTAEYRRSSAPKRPSSFDQCPRYHPYVNYIN